MENLNSVAIEERADVRCLLKKLKSSTVSKLFGKTNLRWFELSFKTNTIGYKALEKDKSFIEQHQFSQIKDFKDKLSVEDKNSCDWKFGFQVILTNKIFTLYAKTENEQNNWLYALKLVLKRVPEAFPLIPNKTFQTALTVIYNPLKNELEGNNKNLNVNTQDQENKPNLNVNTQDQDNKPNLNVNNPPQDNKPNLNVNNPPQDNKPNLNVNNPPQDNKPNFNVNYPPQENKQNFNVNNPPQENKPNFNVNNPPQENKPNFNVNNPPQENKPNYNVNNPPQENKPNYNVNNPPQENKPNFNVNNPPQENKPNFNVNPIDNKKGLNENLQELEEEMRKRNYIREEEKRKQNLLREEEEKRNQNLIREAELEKARKLREEEEKRIRAEMEAEQLKKLKEDEERKKWEEEERKKRVEERRRREELELKRQHQEERRRQIEEEKQRQIEQERRLRQEEYERKKILKEETMKRGRLYDNDHEDIFKELETKVEEVYKPDKKSSNKNIKKNEIKFKENNIHDWDFYDANLNPLKENELIKYNPILQKQNHKMGSVLKTFVKGYIDPKSKKSDFSFLENLHMPKPSNNNESYVDQSNIQGMNNTKFNSSINASQIKLKPDEKFIPNDINSSLFTPSNNNKSKNINDIFELGFAKEDQKVPENLNSNKQQYGPNSKQFLLNSLEQNSNKRSFTPSKVSPFVDVSVVQKERNVYELNMKLKDIDIRSNLKKNTNNINESQLQNSAFRNDVSMAKENKNLSKIFFGDEIGNEPKPTNARNVTNGRNASNSPNVMNARNSTNVTNSRNITNVKPKENQQIKTTNLNNDYKRNPDKNNANLFFAENLIQNTPTNQNNQNNLNNLNNKNSRNVIKKGLFDDVNFDDEDNINNKSRNSKVLFKSQQESDNSQYNIRTNNFTNISDLSFEEEDLNYQNPNQNNFSDIKNISSIKDYSRGQWGSEIQ